MISHQSRKIPRAIAMQKAEDSVKGCITQNYVDDVTMVMWAKHNLSIISYSVCRFWVEIVRAM